MKLCHCGAPTRDDGSQYDGLVCTQWPLCEREAVKEETGTEQEHSPSLAVPIFAGTKPDAWVCTFKGCKHQVDIVDPLRKQEYKKQFIETHPKP